MIGLSGSRVLTREANLKFRTLTVLAAMTLLAELTMPLRLAAEEQHDKTQSIISLAISVRWVEPSVSP
jgi:hypothetical protein